MYAHQVIEEFTKLQNCKKVKDDTKKIIDLLLHAIKNSIKFHIQDEEWLIKTVNRKNLNSQQLINEYYNYIKLPYNFCWIDFPTSKELFIKKIGIMAFYPENENKNFINFVPFFYEKNKYWGTNWFYGGIDLKRNQISYCALPLKNIKDNLLNKNEKFIEEKAMNIHIAGYRLIYFLILMNCKNITTQKHDTPQALNKKRAKKGKLPLFSYHTLIIKPKNPFNNKKEDKNLWSNRIHFCRGHFKKYTKENPLFGKYTGLYWWQPCVRGKNKKGIIMKDYKI